MGLIGETVAKRLQEFDKKSPLIAQMQKHLGIGNETDGEKDIRKLIQDGLDPLHAAYVIMQNLTSVFAEQASVLPELKAYYDVVEPAEEEYMPSGPPMSPLTGSYFTCWAFFDCQFGPDRETIGTCFLEAASQMNGSADMMEVLKCMQNSRMGIYEHLGIQAGRVLLQDIITQENYSCYVPSGYWGEKGQCWLVRLLPPFLKQFGYHIVFTTPYVLIGESKEDWVACIRRTMLGAENQVGSYSEFMKYGLDIHYWNEYIFQAYHHHQRDAIFLKGLPDVVESLPHGDLRKTIENKPPNRIRNRNLRVKKKRKK
jgi:hypothetical protein